MKKQKKFNFRFCRFIIVILVCLFCSFSLVGCVGPIGFTPGTGGSSGSGGSSGTGGSEGSGGSSGEGTEEPDTVSITDYNDVFLGAIGVYEIDGKEEVFYDNYQKKLVNFNFLVERQFDTMATYIYDTLSRIYGVNEDAILYIENFGTKKSINYVDLLINNNQKIISGLSNGQLPNSNYLNYTNSINGGYDIEVTTITADDGTTSYKVQYKTDTVLTDNAWSGKAFFNKDIIKKTLAYIYLNQQDVLKESNQIAFASDTDNNLRNYYSTKFKLNNSAIENLDYSKVNNIGIDRKYLWNVAYYVAFSLIGETNIENSVNNYNSVFASSSIRAIGEANLETLPNILKVYKGYNLVLADLMNNLIKLSIKSDSQLSLTNSNWDTTCFPELKKEKLVYYDNILDVCDAGKKEYEDDYDRCDIGEVVKLKSVVLIPYIDTTKYNNLSSFTIDYMFIGFQAKDNKTYKLSIHVTGLDKDGKAIDSISGFEEADNIKDGKVVFDEKYLISEDFTVADFNLGGEISNCETKLDSNILQLINSTFTYSEKKVVEYDKGSYSQEYNIFYINVYNQLIEKGEYNIKSSLVKFTFNYYDKNDKLLSEIPETSVMAFEVEQG